MNKEIKFKCHCKEGGVIPLSLKGEGNMCSPRVAFTLAEVLITLTIIGVIAALTVPNLMRKWEDHAQLSAFKTAYSLLSSAMKEVIYEYGPLNDWNWPNPSGEKDNGEFLGQRIAPYLKVQKYCGKNSGCFNYGYSAPGYQSYQAKNLSGVIGNYTGYGMELEPIDGGRMILANGMRLKIFYRPYWKTLCYFFIDTNGKKGPNRLGYDMFYIFIDDSKGLGFARDASYCNSRIAGKSTNGQSCAEWVIKHGNMDYKYRDVSAEW